jgi:tetratricopeptide (TPR) repeat protein
MRKTGWLLLIAAAIAVAAPQQRDIGYDLNDHGVEASGRGEFAEAERLLDQAIQFWRPLGPKYDQHVATSLYNKAEAQCGQGKWRDSVATFEEAVALMRGSGGPSYLRTIRYQNALANVHMLLGEREKSEALYKDALAWERELYPDEVDTSHTLAGLSSLYARTSRLDEALPLAEEALRMVLSARGEKDSETAMLYANVAQILTLAGHTERSIPLFRKARFLYEATLGPSTSQIGMILSQEGVAFLKDGKLALAEKDFREGIERLSSCAACALELAVAENHLAALRLEQHKYNDAEALLTKAMAREESFSSRPGSEMAMSLEILSKVRQREKRFDDARQLHARAQAILGYR